MEREKYVFFNENRKQKKFHSKMGRKKRKKGKKPDTPVDETVVVYASRRESQSVTL